MSLSNRLTTPFSHCEDAIAYLLSRLNVKFTRSYLQKVLTEHPDYPSMMSIADILGMEYNIASASLKLDWERIPNGPEIKPPFIAHIRSRELGPVLGIINAFTPDTVDMYNPESKQVEIYSTAAFNEIYLGTVMLIGIEKNTGEREYAKHHKEERQKNLIQHILVFGLPALVGLACVATIITKPFSVIIAPMVFTIIVLMGCLASALLLWHEIDQHNPTLMQICQAGKRVNCSAILDSKASKIFGLRWSRVGFIYFTGMLLVLLTTSITHAPALQALSWVNVLALPYIIFSIYYQWKIAKQWCLLCVFVQILLLLQFITALIGGFHMFLPLDQLSATALLSVVSAFGFAFITTQLLMIALEKTNESRQNVIDLQRLKHNSQIFEALLSKQKAIERPAADLGITIGNPNGVVKLVKICNPYCGPCAKAHTILEDLAENNEDVCLQIIFTATDDAKDIKKAPVAHLLAIDVENDKKLTKKALGDWYNAPVKDYSVFASKYPLNGASKMQDDKIKQMREWCDAAQISFTPTFFICLNTSEKDPKYYQLPGIYTVADLKFFCSI